jgi:hypothetical protein
MTKKTHLIIRHPTTSEIITDKYYNTKKKAVEIGYAEEISKLDEDKRPSKDWLNRNLLKDFKPNKYSEYIFIGYDQDNDIPLWEQPKQAIPEYVPNAQEEASIKIIEELHSRLFTDREISSFLALFYCKNRLKFCLTQLPEDEHLLPLGAYSGERLIRCDVKSLDLLQKISWSIYRRNDDKYEVATGSLDGQIFNPHRLIMGCERGDNKLIDHINGNTTVHNIRLNRLNE